MPVNILPSHQAEAQVQPALLARRRIVLPQLLAGYGIDGVDDTQPGSEIEYAIDSNWLDRGIAERQVHRPGEAKIGYIGLIDVLQRTVVLLAERAAITRPVAAIAAVREARRGIALRRGAGKRKAGQQRQPDAGKRA